MAGSSFDPGTPPGMAHAMDAMATAGDPDGDAGLSGAAARCSLLAAGGTHGSSR